MRKLLMLCLILGLVLTACGGGGGGEDVAQETPERATSEFKTPLPEATEAGLLPTNTPVLPPPTPTPQPTATLEPTAEPEPTATPADETANRATLMMKMHRLRMTSPFGAGPCFLAPAACKRHRQRSDFPRRARIEAARESRALEHDPYH